MRKPRATTPPGPNPNYPSKPTPEMPSGPGGTPTGEIPVPPYWKLKPLPPRWNTETNISKFLDDQKPIFARLLALDQQTLVLEQERVFLHEWLRSPPQT